MSTVRRRMSPYVIVNVACCVPGRGEVLMHLWLGDLIGPGAWGHCRRISLREPWGQAARNMRIPDVNQSVGENL